MASEAKGAMLGSLDDTDNNGAYDSNAREYFEFNNPHCPASEKPDSAKPFSMSSPSESDVCVPPGSASSRLKKMDEGSPLASSGVSEEAVVAASSQAGAPFFLD